MKFKRIILKLSGEALAEEGRAAGINIQSAKWITSEIKSALTTGVQIGIVIGGGNLFRGAPVAAKGEICQAQADRMGMLATIMNGIALQETMIESGVDAVLMSSLEIQAVAEPFDRRMAIRNLEHGSVMIFCGGTGSPFFSTDTAASLRALEVDAEAIFKGTKVDGVYSDDPMKNPKAVRFDKLKYIEVIQKKLRVMDMTAISMCMDHNVPIIVFDIFKKGNLKKAVSGDKLGTVVYG